MNQLLIKDEQKIENMIYEVRGKQVVFDNNLAIFYGTETKRMNEAVKNNPDKFPERFAWQLSNEEYANLKSKFSTSSSNNYGGRRKLPRIFTEQVIAMLATILKTKFATHVSIAIMDSFVAMRKYITNNNYENY